MIESKQMISGASEPRKYVSPVIANLSVTVIGCLLIVLYRLGLQSRDGPDILWFIKVAFVQSIFYLVAVWLILRARTSRSTLVLTLIFATLFRLSILFAPPYLSDDIYRYIWDGRVQAAGINPYRYIPSDEALKNLRDQEIYPKINRRDSAQTIYPPIAEVIYFLTTRVSESVTWMKTTMVLFEALGIWAIVQLLASFGLPRQRILIYAWHPLVVWEFAGSGHIDPLAFAFIALALLARRRNWETATGISLGLATLAKLFPIVLFPALYKRWGWKMPTALAATIVVGYLPYLGVGPLGVLGFIPGYAQERGIVSGGQFFILGLVDRLLGFQLPNAIFLSFAAAVLLGLALWSIFKRGDDEGGYLKRSLVLGTAFMVFFAPDFAWYFAWLIPFLCCVPSIPVFYLTVASFFLYLTWIYWTETQYFKIKALIFVPFFLLVALAVWSRRRKLGMRRLVTALLVDS